MSEKFGRASGDAVCSRVVHILILVSEMPPIEPQKPGPVSVSMQVYALIRYHVIYSP